MIAASDAAVVAIGVATIAAFGSIISAVFAYLGRKQMKTGNGHSAGELLDEVNDRVSRMELWLVEHLRDHTRR